MLQSQLWLYLCCISNHSYVAIFLFQFILWLYLGAASGRLGRHSMELEELRKPMTSPREEQASGDQGAAEHDDKAGQPPHERW